MPAHIKTTKKNNNESRIISGKTTSPLQKKEEKLVNIFDTIFVDLFSTRIKGMSLSFKDINNRDTDSSGQLRAARQAGFNYMHRKGICIR